MSRHQGLLVLAAAAALVFTAFPGIDLWVSGLFYRPGAGFFLGDWGPFRLLYRTVPWITAAVILLAGGSLVLHLRRGKVLFGLGPRKACYLLLSLALGPGLLVNTALKDHWGRARPSQIMEFGGTKLFTPALFPAGQCDHNCSFVAGHPALGFFLVSFAFLVAGEGPRRRAELVALGFGALCGMARIAQGGHFLSDVVFSGLLVYGTSLLLHDLLVDDVPLRHRRPRLAGSGFLNLTAAALLAVTLAYAALDRPLALLFHERCPGTDAFLQAVTRLGVSTWYIIGAAALFLGLRVRALYRHEIDGARRLVAASNRALFVFAAVAVSGLLVDLLKVVFGRARPKLLFAHGEYGLAWWRIGADHWSLPSGHTATAVALATAFSLLWPRGRPVFIAFAVAVASSRVLLTAHYLSDVLLAAFLAVTVTLLLRRLVLRRGMPERQ